MKIKLAILDKDANYLSRINSVFANKFSDKLEVYSFTEAEKALACLKTSKVNVFIASDDFEIEPEELPKHCGFAYLVESSNMESYRDQPTICKYQKAEMIYKTMVDIFSDYLSKVIGGNVDSDSKVQVLTFVSASGGVGSSSAAAACAINLSSVGQKTLYLNLEQFGNAEAFFSGVGQMDFGDVIFALKSKKTNLFSKLESNVRQDSSGVYFYAAPKTALDMMELKTEEIQRLISDLKISDSYKNIVFDIDFSFNESTIEIFKQSSTIVFVSDGSDISNGKLLRAYDALGILEDRFDAPLLPHIAVFYNKFSNKTNKILDNGIRSLGGAPRYSHASVEQVVSQLVGLGIFSKI